MRVSWVPASEPVSASPSRFQTLPVSLSTKTSSPILKASIWSSTWESKAAVEPMSLESAMNRPSKASSTRLEKRYQVLLDHGVVNHFLHLQIEKGEGGIYISQAYRVHSFPRR